VVVRVFRTSFVCAVSTRYTPPMLRHRNHLLSCCEPGSTAHNCNTIWLIHCTHLIYVLPVFSVLLQTYSP
jgi:hypothetical protein